MTTKDPTALVQLFDLLECRYAIRVVWALRDAHPQTFRLLQDSVGRITPNTLNTRLKALRAAGLVEHTREGYRLTASGAELTRRLADLQPFASKWAQRNARSTLNAPGGSPPAGTAHPAPGHPG